MEIWQVVCFIVGISSISTGIIFYLTTNGLLRKIMIGFFSSLAWGTLFLTFNEWFNWVASINLSRLLAMLPICVSIIILQIYIIKNYKKGN